MSEQDDSVERDSLREAVESFPILTFWFGLGFEELCRLPNWVLAMYVEQLPQLLATTEVMMARTSAFPHMKKSAQQQMLSELRSRSRSRRPAKRLHVDEYEKTLGPIGIGFHRD